MAASNAIDKPTVKQKKEPALNPPPWSKAKSEREKLLKYLPMTFANISSENVAIRTGIKQTPCVKSYFLSKLMGANIFPKPVHWFVQGTRHKECDTGAVAGHGGGEVEIHGGHHGERRESRAGAGISREGSGGDGDGGHAGGGASGEGGHVPGESLQY
eukprot:CAMPEP_0172536610 /NCGR_PEP_ID=MMETSP1067-20121228/8349_1 /TAXON_ID=265564 ORGANISM="Thalassiosira punctigera, Strain Tpunct2005C2" /NCGR_SAMPLE_ID=MMETSP1067 /ASSEMBLY_ACC=CAM_ASM_000444 /LENGTH=157 /DNA_ID=CAMNT_0013321717 /DNA_START=262 /DNA_END=735 /DNA_ORIENTATION=-